MTRRLLRSTLILLFCSVTTLTASNHTLDKVTVLSAMKRATTFMTEKVSTQGGYVWTYLPDLSRRWGEMEAYQTMIWIQPPGTPGMGQLFIDAYHATEDEYYYQAAERAARALILGQHPSGGWNYVVDLAGEDSLRRWYETIGKNGWRLEEFQHYYGNATFDDRTTSESARFLLRLYLEKRDPQYKAALDQAIQFVLDAQYPVGGWPQRYPSAPAFSKDGHPDYTSFITFNDEVTAENIDFLIQCFQTLGDQRLLEPIRRAMHVFVITQQPAPQAGWTLQYTPDLKPAGARTYEPPALVTSTTAENITQLLKFYELTGDKAFLARIPEALTWLESVTLPPSMGRGRSHPTFVEISTNHPLFIHRTGSNVVNGRYYADHHPENTVGHYSSFRFVDSNRLRDQYEKALTSPSNEISRTSPLCTEAGTTALPRFFTLRNLNERPPETSRLLQATHIIDTLNHQGYWPSILRSTSHPYKGDGPQEVTTGDFSQTRVGDEYDTSPFPSPTPIMGISVSTYIRNMATLIHYLETESL